MKAEVKWLSERHFRGRTGSGFDIELDAEQKKGCRPMELILVGLGGCASYDLVAILAKGRVQDLECKVEITAERADSVPAVFSSIHLDFIVSGRNLKEAQVERAVRLSVEQYCSVVHMLESGQVAISHSYQLRAKD